MASSQGQSNQPSSSNSRSQGSRAGAKWTEEEEAWLVVNTMKDVTTAWLTENFPGRTRGHNGITGRLSEMRFRNRLSRKWRHKTWADEPPYTLREDIEILQWHVWGRDHIDPEIFVPNQRAGGSVIARADYLCQDQELVSKVKAAEVASQKALEATDEASYNAEHPTDEDPADQSALRTTNRLLLRTEGDNMVKICDAISRSLTAREKDEDGDDEDEGDEDTDEESDEASDDVDDEDEEDDS
ncbi:hypothetical protein FQN49_000014 [Arthroderma sp. PD_2]|nr:hypothetical protein FQN49_000014 [Arthroderma sp. PD_2]